MTGNAVAAEAGGNSSRPRVCRCQHVCPPSSHGMNTDELHLIKRVLKTHSVSVLVEALLDKSASVAQKRAWNIRRLPRLLDMSRSPAAPSRLGRNLNGHREVGGRWPASVDRES